MRWRKVFFFSPVCFSSHHSLFCQSLRGDTDISRLMPVSKQPNVPPGVWWAVSKLTWGYRDWAPCLTLHVDNERSSLQTGSQKRNLCTSIRKWDKKAKIKGLNDRNITELELKRAESITVPGASAYTSCFFLLPVSLWWPSHCSAPDGHFHSH